MSESESPSAHLEKEEEKKKEDMSRGMMVDPGPAVHTATVTYEKRAISHEEVKQLAADFDIVILAAGAGILLSVCLCVLLIALTSWICICAADDYMDRIISCVTASIILSHNHTLVTTFNWTGLTAIPLPLILILILMLCPSRYSATVGGR
jgi:hypothetical protein